MSKTSVLWRRMLTAAQNAAARHGWRTAARIRRDWTEWYNRQLSKSAQGRIDARLRAIFRPSQMRR